MTLTYEPDDTVVHGLDARAKLAVQVGFSVAAFAAPSLRWLAGLTVFTAVVLLLARVSPFRAVRAYWFAFAVLASGPVVAALSPVRPWVAPARAVDPALSVSRVALVLFVGAAYVRTTPVRETRAAIQRHVPGRPGQLLGVGTALTLRFVPLLRADLTAVRDAISARLGGQRSVVERARLLGVGGLARAFTRADRLTLALRARCFAWNPTPPAMNFRRRDYLATALGAVLAASPLLALAC